MILSLDAKNTEFDLFKGLDAPLARHLAHLFIRDPLVIFSELIDQDDTTSTDHFEVGYSCALLSHVHSTYGSLLFLTLTPRTYNRPIGKQSGSSLPPPSHL